MCGRNQNKPVGWKTVYSRPYIEDWLTQVERSSQLKLTWRIHARPKPKQAKFVEESIPNTMHLSFPRHVTPRHDTSRLPSLSYPYSVALLSSYLRHALPSLLAIPCLSFQSTNHTTHWITSILPSHTLSIPGTSSIPPEPAAPRHSSL